MIDPNDPEELIPFTIQIRLPRWMIERIEDDYIADSGSTIEQVCAERLVDGFMGEYVEIVNWQPPI
jgi:hypothetical protein